jgi:hypothetical protein
MRTGVNGQIAAFKKHAARTLRAEMVAMLFLAESRRERENDQIAKNYHVGYSRAVADLADKLNRIGFCVDLPEPTTLKKGGTAK